MPASTANALVDKWLAFNRRGRQGNTSEARELGACIVVPNMDEASHFAFQRVGGVHLGTAAVTVLRDVQGLEVVADARVVAPLIGSAIR